ncbi:hypothetical protein OG21DRAFT_1514967 [Imleria badia]|nr:hypothetical protein OG21DRAFT_1514967 [Imleria badia]
MDILNGRFTLFFLRATSFYSSLLPNLRVLKWRPSVIPQSQPGLSIMFIQRLLVPSLVFLDVALSESVDVSLHSFLANYPFLCPNLKSIVINIDEHEHVSSTTIKVLSQAITHQEHLERLGVSVPIDDVALTHTALSLKVKNLSLMLHPVKSNLHQICIPSDITPFRDVEDLSLEVWDLSRIVTFLRAQDQMFRSFRLCLRSPPTPEAVSTLFSALASCHRVRSLRSLTLLPLDVENEHFAPVELDESIMSQHLSYDTFRPLCSLCHLRELIIDLGCSYSIDDDDLVSLTRNWPLLAVLLLDCKSDHPWRSGKYVTLKGLLSVLECCLDLREISLPLDARVVPVDTWDIVCNPTLTYLYFPKPPINHARSVADFLMPHFSSVTEVTSSFNLPPEEEDVEIELYNVLWAVVDSHFRDMHFGDDDSDS